MGDKATVNMQLENSKYVNKKVVPLQEKVFRIHTENKTMKN